MRYIRVRSDVEIVFNDKRYIKVCVVNIVVCNIVIIKCFV